ncbi:hypothetical protein [Luteimonas sp. SDU82]|uniref:hypothetical protein n=1 Tax=Luteimonas sp. SDU82 TaxID=3422592 RepID=UPI003EB9F609
MQFKDLFVNPALRYALGVEQITGEYYLSIPVANRLADYEEYYRIDRRAFERYCRDPASAHEFLERCRRREADALLFLAPGGDRGVPG